MSTAVALPAPTFRHLLALSDDVGTFEHADGTTPRRDHGYCTDDVARVLLVVAREPDPEPAVLGLGRTALDFVADAQGPNGAVRNRRRAGGAWQGNRTVEDCWGRSLWGLGTAAARSGDEVVRERARSCLGRGIHVRSPWPRAMAFAALGAAEVLVEEPSFGRARDLLADAVRCIGPLGDGPSWLWPEPRLAYANAALAEVLIAAGDLLGEPSMLEDGLALLGWLLARETHEGHLSPTPVDGAAPGDHAPAFDQQPIEVAHLADACARALAVTADARWRYGLELACRWFVGANDVGAVLWDPQSGGGFDGLHLRGPNRNQGAESTLAFVSTMQHGRAVALVPA